MSEQKLLDYMKKVNAQNIVSPRGILGAVEQLAAGETSIQLYVASAIEAFKGRGASVDWVLTKPVVINPLVIFIVDDAPHPAGGSLFSDFLLSEEDQKIAS